MKQIIGTSLSLVLLANSVALADGLLPPEGQESKSNKTFIQGLKSGLKGDSPADQASASIQPEVPVVVQSPQESNSEIKKYSTQEFERLITINKQVLPIRSRLKSMYSGYKVTIISDYPGTLAIKNANITNGVPGSVATTTVNKSPWKGCLWALIPYAGIIIGPTVAITSGVKNVNTIKESAHYASQIPLGDLKRGEPVTFNTLVPAGQTPVMTIKLIDKDNSQEYILSSI